MLQNRPQFKSDITAILIRCPQCRKFHDGYVEIFTLGSDLIEGVVDGLHFRLALSAIGPLLAFSRPIGGIVQDKNDIRNGGRGGTIDQSTGKKINIFSLCLCDEADKTDPYQASCYQSVHPHHSRLSCLPEPKVMLYSQGKSIALPVRWSVAKCPAEFPPARL